MKILLLLFFFVIGACFAGQINAELSQRFKDAKFIYLSEVVLLEGDKHKVLKVIRVYKGERNFAEKAFKRQMDSKIKIEVGSLYLETWSEDWSYTMQVADSKSIKINGEALPFTDIEVYLENTYKPQEPGNNPHRKHLQN